MAIGSWTLGIESGSFESVRILSCHQSFGCGIDSYSSQYLQLDFSLCQLNRAWMHYFFSKNPAGFEGLRERDGCVFDWFFSFNSPFWVIPPVSPLWTNCCNNSHHHHDFPGCFLFAALLRAFSRSTDDLISFDSEVLCMGFPRPISNKQNICIKSRGYKLSMKRVLSKTFQEMDGNGLK